MGVLRRITSALHADLRGVAGCGMLMLVMCACLSSSFLFLFFSCIYIGACRAEIPPCVEAWGQIRLLAQGIYVGSLDDSEMHSCWINYRGFRPQLI